MKKSLISMLIFVFIISIFTVVNAATGSINLGASSDKVKVGDIFTISIIGTADNNISALQANLVYDTNKIAIENKTVGEGFYDASANNEIAIAAQNSDALSKTATLYTFTFKVLDTAAVGETTIEFKNIAMAVINDSKQQETITISDDSVSVDIEKVEEPAPSEEDDKKTEEDKTTAGDKKEETKLPQTGIESTIIIAIAILGIVSIVSYTAYKKYRNI